MKDKENNLKAPREKWYITNKGKTVWMTANFSSEIMEAGRKCFKCWKNYQLWILYLVKISLKNENVIKATSGEGQWREFVTSRFLLKEWLKEILLKRRKIQTSERDRNNQKKQKYT